MPAISGGVIGMRPVTALGAAGEDLQAEHPRQAVAPEVVQPPHAFVGHALVSLFGVSVQKARLGLAAEPAVLPQSGLGLRPSRLRRTAAAVKRASARGG